MEPKIVLHGGAGSWGEKEEDAQEALEKVADEVAQTSDFSDALDMVENAVRLLEDEPVFNAGRGGKFQADGEIRLDASLMTSDLEAGAVIGLEGGFLHAVSVARKVMEETHHVALKGCQAADFAEEYGFEKADLRTEVKKEAYSEQMDDLEDLSYREKIRELKDREQNGTVGAVAIDRNGDMAAATSTGGRYGQLAGRVGDTPMPGNGTYCNESSAVSATGVGEAIIKSTLSRRCAEVLERGKVPENAAREAIDYLEDKTGRKLDL
ncbi:MAG: isoaspartyl peptidase/L-asparaginase family protein [Candidatus Nanohalobium sp.]